MIMEIQHIAGPDLSVPQFSPNTAPEPIKTDKTVESGSKSVENKSVSSESIGNKIDSYA